MNNDNNLKELTYDAHDDSGTAKSLKDDVARELGRALDELPVNNTLVEFEEQYSSAIRDALPENSGQGDEVTAEDWESLESQYEDEYQEYKDGVYEQASEDAREEFDREYRDDRDEALANAGVAASALNSMWGEARAQLVPFDAEGKQGELPGFEDSDLHRIGEIEPDTDAAVKFLRDAGAYNNAGKFDGDTSLADVEKTYGDDREGYEDFVKELQSWRTFPDEGDVRDALLDTTDRFDSGDVYGRKYESESEGFDSDLNPDVDSFQEWYTNNHGEPTFSDGAAPGSLEYTTGQRVANYLISKWAGTSGDDDGVAIAMQLAANGALQLGATNSARFTTASAPLDTATRIYAQHRDLMQTFVKTMYANTQKYLIETLGLDPEGYVNLYRGMSVPKLASDEMSYFPDRGAIVDVRLQPMSSFSARLGTANSFSSNYGQGTGTVAVMRVPVKQILATPYSGYWCLNEFEVVVLGGRYPAMLTRSGGLKTGSAGAAQIRSQMQDALDRWRSSTGRGPKTILGPGDAG